MMQRPSVPVVAMAIMGVCVCVLLWGFHLVPKSRDYDLYSEDGLVVITSLGEILGERACLVVNALGKPVANFAIEGDRGSAVCDFMTDDHGRAEILAALSVKIGGICIDMENVRSILVVVNSP